MIQKSGTDILSRLPEIEQRMRESREIFLSNLIMIGEISAPTFKEERRAGVLKDRFVMCGLERCSTDEKGNVISIIHGSEGHRNVLITANIDTVFSDKTDHTISIEGGSIVGPGLSDNTVGLAIMASLPTFLAQLGIELKSNILLMCAAQGLGRGNNGGLRFFLDNSEMPISGGICLEGVHLGRLSHSSIGMMRGEIRCEVPRGYDWTRFGAVGAIDIIHQIISRIKEIPLPGTPRTSVVLGATEAGHTFNEIARKGFLRFEIRSESRDMVNELHKQVRDIVEETSMMTGTPVILEHIAERAPGGIPFSHHLVRSAYDVMKGLGIEPRSTPSSSELAVFIEREIPAIVLGITDGINLSEKDESLLIEPVFRGIAQIIGVLMAIDDGYGDDKE